MKKILLSILFLLLITSCSINNNEEELNNKISKLEKEKQELDIELQELVDKNSTKDPLKSLINIKGVNPEKFYYGPCVYLHGKDGKIRNWKQINKDKKDNLYLLFSENPLVKLDYSKNPNNISDEIYIGPLCDCEQYNKAEKIIGELKLNFKSQLFHGTDGFGSCIDMNNLYQ